MRRKCVCARVLKSSEAETKILCLLLRRVNVKYTIFTVQLQKLIGNLNVQKLELATKKETALQN